MKVPFYRLLFTYRPFRVVITKPISNRQYYDLGPLIPFIIEFIYQIRRENNGVHLSFDKKTYKSFSNNIVISISPSLFPSRKVEQDCTNCGSISHCIFKRRICIFRVSGFKLSRNLSMPSCNKFTLIIWTRYVILISFSCIYLFVFIFFLAPNRWCWIEFKSVQQGNYTDPS